MYKLYNDLQLKIIENQDSYRNKGDFRFFLLTKSSFVEWLTICMYVYCIYYYYYYYYHYSKFKVDYRGAAATKNEQHFNVIYKMYFMWPSDLNIVQYIWYKCHKV